MRSETPKVLHTVCGRSVIGHAIATSRAAGAARVVCVIGSGAERVREALADEDVEFCVQAERLGTAHAVAQTRALLGDHAGPVLVMYGDHPLFTEESFRRLVQVFAADGNGPSLALLTGRYPDESHFGRVVRGPDGSIERIVEHADASPETRALPEVNLGVYLLGAERLFAAVERIGNDNPSGEYYLTDLVELIRKDGGRVETAEVEDWDEAFGINSRADLALAEQMMRRRIARRWLDAGVTLRDPERTYIDADVTIGADTVLAPGVSLLGRTSLGRGCRIDAGCVVEDSTLGDEVWLKPHSSVEESSLGRGCIAGPAAHLRPNSRLADRVRIGNFVEVKNSNIGAGTKADHLSYIGDADVGEDVTFACGAITVNYDGRNKHRTTVGSGSFVGCNVNLIAPVVVEPQSYVAAGSTITVDVPSHALAVGRGRQRNILGWWKKKFGRQDGQ